VVDVKEAQTGAFSAGAASARRLAPLQRAIQENNLFGRGQRLTLSGDIGSIRRNIIPPSPSRTRDTPSRSRERLQLEAFLRRLRPERHWLRHPGHVSGDGLGLHVALGAAARRVRVGSTTGSSRRRSTGSGSTPRARSASRRLEPHLERDAARVAEHLNHAFDPTAGSFQDASLEVAGLGGEQF
jgi:outer membrane protein assembly factor BamA